MHGVRLPRKLSHLTQAESAQARETLSMMRAYHPEAEQLFREWEVLLGRPVPGLLPALIDPSPRGRELRHLRPFAGTLTARERTEVYQAFREEESR